MYIGKGTRNKQFQWCLYMGLFETACITIEPSGGMKARWYRNKYKFSWKK